MTDESIQPPAAPSGAAVVFGEHEPLAVRYVALLADTGVTHGLIGPREVPRLWERHVLNCAVIQDVFEVGASVIDVGSGAGLPGIALAIARPDLEVTLVEPMLRRTTWLAAAVAELDLPNVEVKRARAEELAGQLSSSWVTARAVARLAKLARWCVPLLAPGGTLVAMKGSNARAELEEDRALLSRMGLTEASVQQHGAGVLDEPTVTVNLRFAESRSPRAGGSRPGGTSHSSRRKRTHERERPRER